MQQGNTVTRQFRETLHSGHPTALGGSVSGVHAIGHDTQCTPETFAGLLLVTIEPTQLQLDRTMHSDQQLLHGMF